MRLLNNLFSNLSDICFLNSFAPLRLCVNSFFLNLDKIVRANFLSYTKKIHAKAQRRKENQVIDVLVAFIMIFSVPLSASTAKQVVSVCYFEEDRMNFEIPRIPNFLKGGSGDNVEKGYMLFYERKIFDVLSMFSFYGGGNIGRYHKNDDTLYSASLSVASRFWLMHLILLHPYIEASFFGPTILSKSEFNLNDLKSNFLFQNYFSVGAEIGAGSGLSVELKAVKYFKANLVHPEQGGVMVPLLISLGYLF